METARLRHRWTDELLPPGLNELRTEVTASAIPELVASCEIDRAVPPSPSFSGGSAAAAKHLRVFLKQKLSRYARESNRPSKHATSDLSPYLHFGQISALEVALAVQAYAAEHKLMAGGFSNSRSRGANWPSISRALRLTWNPSTGSRTGAARP